MDDLRYFKLSTKAHLATLGDCYRDTNIFMGTLRALAYDGFATIARMTLFYSSFFSKDKKPLTNVGEKQALDTLVEAHARGK